MRKLFAIFKYEFLMQIRSGRFIGLLILSGLVNFGLYEGGANRQELDPFNTIFAFEVQPFYLAAVVLAGLFSMSRIRTTGMHPILMLRPFPTYLLALGQMIAGMLSTLILGFLFFFPAGLLLKWQFDIDYPVLQILRTMLFIYVPDICCILAMTIWVRTCFKNNIMALIILGIMFALMMPLAQSPILNFRMPDSREIHHNFVPMVSLFSPSFWDSWAMRARNNTLSFTNAGDWFNFLLSLVYCNIFLLLSCYHLRRTEPQRKVLGSYGRRWYHAPTFVKIAADIKIDPHVTWRSHLLLVLLAGVVAFKTVLPIAQPFWNAYKMARKSKMDDQTIAKLSERYDPNRIPEERILRIRVLRQDETITPDSFQCDLTISCEQDTSGTIAVLANWRRWQYPIDEITLDGQAVPYHLFNSYYFFEGADLKALNDNAAHHMTVKGSIHKLSSSPMEAAKQYMYFTQNPKFIHNKRRINLDTSNTYFDWNNRNIWPARFSLTVNWQSPPLDSPVPPTKIEKHETGKYASMTTYTFDIPAELNGPNAKIVFSYYGEGRDALLKFKDSPIQFQIAVDKDHENITRDILELAEPVVAEFCALHGIPIDNPMIIRSLNNSPIWDIEKMRQRLRYSPSRWQWMADNMYSQLDAMEMQILTDIYFANLYGKGPQSESQKWDIYPFMQTNIKRGMNRHISLNPQFESKAFGCVNQHINVQQYRTMEKTSRKDQLHFSQIPIFQMLYHVLEHENFLRMMQSLRNRLQTNFLTADVLQDAVRETTGDSMDWFFDYWMRNGTGLPSYFVESAIARILPTEKDDEALYEVEAVIKNLGTGRMPVPLRLETAKGAINDKIWIGSGETVTWKTQSKYLPMNLIVDPEGWILMSPVWNEKMKTWDSTIQSKVTMQVNE